MPEVNGSSEFSVDAASGLLRPARLSLSPNRDARDDRKPVAMVVLHGISLPPGEFGGPGIDQLFTNTLDPDEHPYYQEIAK